jgi:hypothetical protein
MMISKLAGRGVWSPYAKNDWAHDFYETVNFTYRVISVPII